MYITEHRLQKNSSKQTTIIEAPIQKKSSKQQRYKIGLVNKNKNKNITFLSYKLRLKGATRFEVVKYKQRAPQIRIKKET